MKLIEAFFEIITQILKGVFNLLQLILGIPENDKLYNATSMKFMDRIRVFSRFHRGLILNGKNQRLSKKSSKIHACIIGKSGVGKSSVFYMGNLLSPGAKSFIVTDLDGGLNKASSGYLKSIGYDIQVFNLSNVKKSSFYCPLSFCYTDDELKSLAVQIVMSSSNNSGTKDKFWEHSSIKLLFTLLKLVKTQELKYQNLANVNHLLTMIELEEFDNFVSQHADDKLFKEILAFKSIDEKLRTNIEATLSATLDLLSYNDIGFITSKNTIDFERLAKPKSILYIIVNERHIRQYSLIISIFYSQLFNYYQQNKPKNIIYFLLDEGGVYKINELEILTSILRRYQCSISLAVQDFNQLIQLYGREAAAIIYNNCSTKIVFSGASLTLSENISRMMGQKTVEISFEGKKVQQTRPVLTPTEIMQIKSNKVLIQHSNYSFIKVHTYPYYKQMKLKRRSRIKPLELEQNIITSPSLLSLEKTPPPDEE